MRQRAKWLICVGGLAFAVVVPMLLRAQDRDQPTLPSKFGLDRKWETFQSRPLTAQSIAAMLKEDPGGTLVVPWGASRHTSIWSGVQRRISANAEIAAQLREAQEAEAPAILDEAGRGLEKLMVVARQLPWADAVHRALLEVGALELRRGHTNLAWRCFQDALTRTDDADLRAEAQVGLWLAMAHNGHGEELNRALKDIDPKATFPWADGKISAEEIRRRIAPKAADPVKLKALDRKVLRVPDTASGAVQRPTVTSAGVAFAGSNVLSWFEPGHDEPKWTRPFPSTAATELWGSLTPGPYQPAVGDGRIYARWGIQAHLRNGPKLLTHVAAFDAGTGAQRWTTDGNPDWQDLCPVCDPTFADGRIYLLAVSPTKEVTPIHLVCFAADSGVLLWKRELATHQVSLPRDGVNVVQQGNAVTVARGMVYCLTHMGVVACCDARDGLIEWLRTYPQDRDVAKLRRPGSSPLLAGKHVLFVPRDAAIIFAADAADGERAWQKRDDTTLHFVGATDGIALLAASRVLTGLKSDTGEMEWDLAFNDPIDGRTFLVGESVYIGMKKNIKVLNAKSGDLVEEDEWGKGPFWGLALSDRTLLALTTGDASFPVKAGPGPVRSSETVRFVYRSAQVPRMDGRATEWDKLQSFAWEGSGEVKGRAMLGHDDRNLYIGLTASGGPPGDRELEVTLAASGTQFRWLITLSRGRDAVLEGIGTPAPTGVKAASYANLVDDSVSVELAVPLASLVRLPEPKPVRPNPFPNPFPPKVEPPPPDPKTANKRLGLELVYREQANKSALVHLEEKLFLHDLTQQQELAGVKAARSLLDMDVSWQFLEQSWRLRAHEVAGTDDFYRDFIKSDPQSPAARAALVRLDQLLRKDLATNPKEDILKFAADAGVPEATRAWYKRAASISLSQWVYSEDDYEPQAVEVELYDGQTRDHRVVAIKKTFGKTPEAILPKLGKLSRSTAFADGAPVATSSRRTVSGLVVGHWDRFRIPLIWLDMHDKPIHGIGFRQTGGSTIYWDRTVLTVGDKEIVLIDDNVSRGQALGKWDWDVEHVKIGKKSHTTPHPQYKNEDARHTITFAEPVTDHIVQLPEKAITSESIVALAQETLPLLAVDDFALALFDRAALALRADPPARAGLCRAILQNASVDDIPLWLENFVRMEQDAGNADPSASVKALVKECKLPERAFKDFLNRTPRAVVRDWQVIGPFAPTDAAVEKPGLETEAIQLDQRHKGLRGKVGWQLHKSASGRVDLNALFDKTKSGTAYAVCWVHSDTKQAALMKVTSDDRAQAWLNSRIVIDEAYFRPAGQASSAGLIELSRGWNEVLLMLDSRSGRWAFSVEFRERDDTRPLEGLQIQAQPPKKDQEN